MNIYLTLDYEIYFGRVHGTVEECILKPTRELMRIAKAHQVRMTYFVDVGFIRKLDEFRKQFPQLEKDYQDIVAQVKALSEQGHDCQLHIHPHWEDSSYNGTSWDIDVSRYKLADFEEAQVYRIVKEYHQTLTEITNKPVTTYRAGGWCLQPFSKVHRAFEELGVTIDSTVFRGGFNDNSPYFYDFRKTPEATRWHFNTDLCEENKEGSFLEVPITSQSYSPLFFWQLFGWGRLNPKNHKPMGNGFPVPSGSGKKKLLTQTTHHPVSLDGYFVTGLSRAVRNVAQAGKGEDVVIIGHPKACTYFSLKRLEKFIKKHKADHNFKIMSEA